MKKFFFFIFLISFSNYAQAWFETCNYEYTIPTTSTTYFTSTNYPSRYPVGSSCKWYLTAPAGYTIELKCQIQLDTPLVNCQSQSLYISRDGDKSLSYSDFFCGATTITRVSVGNEISFGYTSNTGGNGWVYCAAKTTLTTQNNCQCGWNKAVRNFQNTFLDVLSKTSHQTISDTNRRRISGSA